MEEIIKENWDPKNQPNRSVRNDRFDQSINQKE